MRLIDDLFPSEEQPTRPLTASELFGCAVGAVRFLILFLISMVIAYILLAGALTLVLYFLGIKYS
jgi:hypothetical protein